MSQLFMPETICLDKYWHIAKKQLIRDRKLYDPYYKKDWEPEEDEIYNKCYEIWSEEG